MGFFSWKTQDTNKSIANQHSINSTFRVKMLDDKGNEWVEDKYDGYGEFGGKDYYELLAEMNGLDSNRSLGINLAFKNSPNGDNPEVNFPNLVEISDGWKYERIGPDSCAYQGFFYEDDNLINN